MSAASSLPALDDHTLDELERWLDVVPFSRPRRSMTRDFSDGLLVAEIVAHFLPRYINIHNYVPASSTPLKKYNWQSLNKYSTPFAVHCGSWTAFRMVFSRLNFHVHQKAIDQVVACVPGAIEALLWNLRIKIELVSSQRRFTPRTYRSRSSSRAENTFGMSNGSLSEDERVTSAPQCLHHLPNPKKMNLTRLAISAPTGAPESLCEDLVPGRLLHAAQRHLLAKDEQIQSLQARVRHLERLGQLKDERIGELTQRLDRLAQAFHRQQQNSPSSADDAAAAHQRTAAQLLAVRSLISSLQTSAASPRDHDTPHSS